MHKKWLLSVLVFSCVVTQAIIIADESDAQENPFAQLPTHLRQLREDPDNAIYADVMINGLAAIKKAKENKLAQIEKDRAEKKRKVSSNRGSWGSEEIGTDVYNADQIIDAKLNHYIKEHQDHAAGYHDATSYMFNDLTERAKEDLVGKVAAFRTMKTAVERCQPGNDKCFRLYGAPIFNDISDQLYRDAIKNATYFTGLQAAHENGIPVTESELKAIFHQNPDFCQAIQAIDLLDSDINDVIDPEKIKEREEKKRQELEDKKNKEDQERQQRFTQ